MAVLTLQNLLPVGLVPVYSGANVSDTVKAPTGQRVFLHVKNGGGASINVTIPAIQTTSVVAGVGGLTIPDNVVAVAAGSEGMIGPFTEAYMSVDSDVTINYSSVTSVTAAVFQLPAQY